MLHVFSIARKQVKRKDAAEKKTVINTEQI